jgi:hypothetical protein
VNALLRHSPLRAANRELVTASTNIDGCSRADAFMNNLLAEAKQSMEAVARPSFKLPRSRSNFGRAGTKNREET